MPVDLRHLFVSPVAPANNSGRLVQGPNWNEAHNLQQGPQTLLGRSDAAAGQAATQEIQLDPSLGFVGGKLAAISGGPPSGPAGGALTGTYPNPTLVGGPLSNYALISSIPTTLPPSGAASGDLAGTYPAPTIKANVGLTGTPTAPTATPATTNTTQIATTAFVQSAVPTSLPGPPTGAAGGALAGTYPNPTLVGGPLSNYALTSSIPTTLPPNGAAGGALAGTYPNPTLVGGPLSLYAPLASPVFTGDPQAPSPAAGDADFSIPTTAWVQAELSELPVGGATLTGYWNSNTAVLVPPPASGRVRLSVAWPPAVASSLHMYISSTDNDGFVYTWGVGPSVGNPLVFRSASGARGQFQITAMSIVAGSPGYLDLTVTTQSALGSYTNNSRCQIAVLGGSAMPSGAAGGDLTGTYPNPTIKSSVVLTGTPTVPGYLPLSGGALSAADSATIFGVKGTTKGVRIGTDATGGHVDAVDSTLTTSFQPLFLAGSVITLQAPVSGSTATFSGDMTANSCVAQNATGNARILFNSQSNPVDTRKWIFTDFSDGNFYLQPTNDAETPTSTWSFLRNGNTTLPTSSTLTGTTATFSGTVSTNGFAAGYLQVPQNAQTGNYTAVLADSGKHLYHAVAAAAATYTIPANASVAYPIGTSLSFVNDSANAVTIAITTDTLVLSPGTTTGSRTLATGGVATALKVTSTRWIINGTGLT